MKLYNTLSREVEVIKPQNPPKVSVYTCGPTVYDYPHIGNWFTFIRYDVLIRSLKAIGYNPKWVMNITDVGHLTSDADEGEDKLEVGAKREGKSAWGIAKKYTDYFTNGLDRLNIVRPNELVKATDTINEQVELVKSLEKKGFTYKTRDGVYFDTAKFKSYGELAKLDIGNLMPGARVVLNPEKKNPTDFALWKFSPKFEKRDMEWESPWGKGFPGWHLECSAIVMKHFGETVDIHAGGIDHIPTHHTNEIAQSESVTDKKLANHWMHCNFLLIDNKKIAKSAGTFITLEDVERKGYSLEALRLLVLESHYRTEAHFSWNNLEAAENRLTSYRAMADLQWQAINRDTKTDQSMTVLLTKTIPEELLKSANSDLDTPQMLTTISKLESFTLSGISMHSVEIFRETLKMIDQLTGLKLSDSKDITSDQKDLVQNREKARTTKNWGKADKLRQKLEKQGIIVRDTDNGPIWCRL